MSRQAPRQSQVLALIIKYGLISTKTVWELMDREISLHQVRGILYELQKKNLIISPNQIFGPTALKYWSLPLDSKRLRSISQIMEFPFEELRHSAVRFNEYPHEDLCTIIQASIERVDSSLKVFRARARKYFGIPDWLISARIKRLGYCPDLILRLPVYEGAGEMKPNAYRWIAVEVDRTYRTRKRLAQRLTVYTKHTQFGGLLYFLPTSGSAKKLHQIYEIRGGKENLRLHNGHETFLATAVPPKSLFNPDELKVFVGTGETRLLDWLAIFSMSTGENEVVPIFGGVCGEPHFLEVLR
jgi:hypothetical protein